MAGAIRDALTDDVTLNPERRDPARERLAKMSGVWGVAVQDVKATPSSLIAFGMRGDVPVVLKIAKRRHDEWDAGAVISAFGGAGMVCALEHAPGAVLLERLIPGTRLVTLVEAGRDSEANRVLASVINAMGEAVPELGGYPTALDQAGAFDRYLSSGLDFLPTELVRVGGHVYKDLCTTQDSVRLLHGDLQHYNILLDEERGWLAIDPKGVVAETEFEVGAALRNPHGIAGLHTTEALRARAEAFSSTLGLDLPRVLRWTFAQAVLSAIWMIEDGEPYEADAPILAIVRASRPFAT
jgi:streptomycin 6-kinase